ncbi:MAG: vWA domain-containing protein [Anaerolineaceae bacterium]
MDNRTELVFILDKSGSMGGREADTIGGFNRVLEKQKQVEGAATVTTVLFDDRIEILHDRLDLHGVSAITVKDYFVEGSTALLDAIGNSIQKIEKAQQALASEYRAKQVMFTIITDGMENASRRFDFRTVRAMIEQKKAEGWEFIFLGANIDAISAAQDLGIAPDRAQNFIKDARGIQANYNSVSDAATMLRGKGKIDEWWDQEIKKDLKDRESPDTNK